MLVDIDKLKINAGTLVPIEIYDAILSKVESYTDPIDTKKWVAQLISIVLMEYDTAVRQNVHQEMMEFKTSVLSNNETAKKQMFLNFIAALESFASNADGADLPAVEGILRAIEIAKKEIV